MERPCRPTCRREVDLRVVEPTCRRSRTLSRRCMRANKGSMGEGELRPRFKRCAESLSSQRAYQGRSPDNGKRPGCTARGSTRSRKTLMWGVGSSRTDHRTASMCRANLSPTCFGTAYIRTTSSSHAASVVSVKRVFASVESCRRGTHVGRFHPITTTSDARHACSEWPLHIEAHLFTAPRATASGGPHPASSQGPKL
jgi:hypothetical protein